MRYTVNCRGMGAQNTSSLVRRITRAAADQEYRMSAFILGVVSSPAFLMSRPDAVTAEQVSLERED